MNVSHHSPVIGRGPEARLMHVFSWSLAHSAKLQAMTDAEARCEDSSEQCRILLDAARREINRLQLGLDSLEITAALQAAKDCTCPGKTTLAAEPRAAVPGQRKAYAVDPLGRWPRLHCPDLAPDAHAPPLAQRLLRVTNLGTLLDVLV